MARLARIVAPGVPHHIVQRGNRRQQTFFSDVDYRAYVELMAEWCAKYGVAVWAWCLMPNHVHLIVVPERAEGLARAIGETHRRYTRAINAREDWSGYLWQGRFASCPLDEAHLLAAARYIERNPVRAKLVTQVEAWQWSSAGAHLAGKDDLLTRTAPLLELVPEWRAFIAEPTPEETLKRLRLNIRTGRPLGDSAFVERIERALGRSLRPGRRGPKPAAPAKA